MAAFLTRSARFLGVSSGAILLLIGIGGKTVNAQTSYISPATQYSTVAATATSPELSAYTDAVLQTDLAQRTANRAPYVPIVNTAPSIQLILSTTTPTVAPTPM